MAHSHALGGPRHAQQRRITPTRRPIHPHRDRSVAGVATPHATPPKPTRTDVLIGWTLAILTALVLVAALALAWGVGGQMAQSKIMRDREHVAHWDMHVWTVRNKPRNV